MTCHPHHARSCGLPDPLRRIDKPSAAAPSGAQSADRGPATTPGGTLAAARPGLAPTAARPSGALAAARPGRALLRLALAAPRDAAGLTSEWRTIDGLRTHVRRSVERGQPTTPVLLVHGLAVSHRYLTPLAVTLAETHPVYAPDLPGFGLSDRPRAAYDPRQHAEHLAALLAAYRLPPVCVLGHSFGAEVAAALAAHHPEAVRAVVLAGPTSDPRARSRQAQIRRFLVDATREARWQAPILLRDVVDARPWRVWATLSHSIGNRIENDLSRITAPTLVLTGSRDPIVPTPWRSRVAELVPGGRTVAVPGAAHNVATTAPWQVADAVRTLLDPSHPDKPTNR
ncbi:alpha/beta hydrolase [Micromonospora sp. FIMYZ51]|uniref:alpha/beta fold hydrolase n=1 Tax=Micromonospora sp. FIMYZ51 TaxID=3051832 RepID=UPI0031203DBF